MGLSYDRSSTRTIANCIFILPSLLEKIKVFKQISQFFDFYQNFYLSESTVKIISELSNLECELSTREIIIESCRRIELIRERIFFLSPQDSFERII